MSLYSGIKFSLSEGSASSSIAGTGTATGAGTDTGSGLAFAAPQVDQHGGSAPAPAKLAKVDAASSAALRFAPRVKAKPAVRSGASTTFNAGVLEKQPTVMTALHPSTRPSGAAASSGITDSMHAPQLGADGRPLAMAPSMTISDRDKDKDRRVKRDREEERQRQKRKKKRRQQQQHQQRSLFDPDEMYDPARPNDLGEWQQYRKRVRAERRQRLVDERRRREAGESSGSSYYTDSEEEAAPRRDAPKLFAPPKLYSPPRSIAPLARGRSGSPPAPSRLAPAPVAETGDEAYARRLALAQGRGAAAPATGDDAYARRAALSHAATGDDAYARRAALSSGTAPPPPPTTSAPRDPSPPPLPPSDAPPMPPFPPSAPPNAPPGLPSIGRYLPSAPPAPHAAPPFVPSFPPFGPGPVVMPPFAPSGQGVPPLPPPGAPAALPPFPPTAASAAPAFLPPFAPSAGPPATMPPFAPAAPPASALPPFPPAAGPASTNAHAPAPVPAPAPPEDPAEADAFAALLEERKKAAAAIAAKFGNLPAAKPKPVPMEQLTGTFAEKMMKRWGHVEGQGIGARSDGIVEALSTEHVSKAPVDPSKLSKRQLAKQKVAAANALKRKWVQAPSARGRIVDSSAEKRAEAERERLGEASRVVCLSGLVEGEEDVDEDLPDEVGEECAKVGIVERVVMHMVEPPPVERSECVRVFVVFSGMAGAWRAIKELDGRFFGGRKIKAVYYDEARFDRGERDATL